MSKIIMPLTVEPSKLPLCHDDRYLNLWTKGVPFKRETERCSPIDKDAGMITCDEKSRNDHEKLPDESHTYFGVQYGGCIKSYTTLVFGGRPLCTFVRP